MSRGLVTGPWPQCSAPDTVSGLQWSQVSSDQFSCPPQISVDHDTVHAAVGDNFKLHCYVQVKLFKTKILIEMKLFLDKVILSMFHQWSPSSSLVQSK